MSSEKYNREITE